MNAFTPDPSFLCHENNILQKHLRASGNAVLAELVADVERRYRDYRACVKYEKVAFGDLSDAVRALGDYLDFAKTVESSHSMFNWRSDFAGSVIPEFLYLAFGMKSHSVGIDALFSTRNSIVEISLSGIAGGGWDVRRKNQDLCVGVRHERVARGAGEETFLVPVVALEVKTNIDINKLNGLDFSAERLKRTFPSARYFLVTETIDFSLADNYASGSIDEIYALRKQVRSQARRNKESLKVDVFSQLQFDVVTHLRRAGESAGHVYERLAKGKLINAK